MTDKQCYVLAGRGLLYKGERSEHDDHADRIGAKSQPSSEPVAPGSRRGAAAGARAGAGAGARSAASKSQPCCALSAALQLPPTACSARTRVENL